MRNKGVFVSLFSLILFAYLGCGKNDSHQGIYPIEEAECNNHNLEINESPLDFLGLTSLPVGTLQDHTGLPLLQSNPGAKLALFLDFNGGSYYGYQDYYGPADLDGKPLSFSDIEAERIYAAFLHVVEAFDGLDVNVTTQEDKAKMASQWAWIIISDDYSKTGGKGKVGIFDRSSYNYGRPTQGTALAGSQAVLNPRNYEIGYLLVHELGHNFGLRHAGRIDNNIFVEYSDYDSGPVGSFMGGRGEQFDKYVWMSLQIENGERQDSFNKISKITGYADKDPNFMSEGEGDCDDTSECQLGLACINTDTGTEESFANKVPGPETCEYIMEDENSMLLGEGEGDCDDTSECQLGLTCINTNTGTEESFANKVSGSETCEYILVDDNSFLLGEGEGDCDDSSECELGLSCLNSNGLIESFDNKISGSETCQVLSQNREIRLLEEGEGDCDNSHECAGNLVCLNPTTGQTEEKNSNDNGFVFTVENEIDQPGDETCQLPETRSDNSDEDIKYADDTLVVKSANKWYFVYCSGRDVKLSRDWNKKQTWVKFGARNIGLLNGPKLYCPELDGGFSPTKCECSSRTENYHEKRKDNDSHFDSNVAAPASITTNDEIYIGPNNNMNSCLKVVKNKKDNSLQIHSPCALEPWKTKQKCAKGGDYNLLLNAYTDPEYSSKNVHDLACSEFRLNN